MLLIDANRDRTTGWEGYDFVVNHGTLLGLVGNAISFDFKSADNLQEGGSVAEFTLNGDSAPSDRYNCRLRFSP